MKELGLSMQLYLASQVVGISNQQVSCTSGYQPVSVFAHSLSLEARPIDSNSGILYEIQEDIGIEKLSSTVAAQFRQKKKVIIRLQYTDGDAVVLGSLDFPALVSVTTHVQNDRLHLMLRTLTNPL